MFLGRQHPLYTKLQGLHYVLLKQLSGLTFLGWQQVCGKTGVSVVFVEEQGYGGGGVVQAVNNPCRRIPG
jgi:hypothetical protein